MNLFETVKASVSVPEAARAYGLTVTRHTASPEFFQNKSMREIRAFFREALDFLEQKQNSNTIISAVVHMDEKTPYMHLSFVPLTEDGRLCAKEIIGNKKKLTKWQDAYRMYDKIDDQEQSLIEARAKKQSIESEKVTGDNIYKVLIYFDKFYKLMNEEEQRKADGNPH